MTKWLGNRYNICNSLISATQKLVMFKNTQNHTKKPDLMKSKIMSILLILIWNLYSTSVFLAAYLLGKAHQKIPTTPESFHKNQFEWHLFLLQIQSAIQNEVFCIRKEAFRRATLERGQVERSRSMGTRK